MNKTDYRCYDCDDIRKGSKGKIFRKKLPGKIFMHWMEAAYWRMLAGESEKNVMADYGYVWKTKSRREGRGREAEARVDREEKPGMRVTKLTAEQMNHDIVVVPEEDEDEVAGEEKHENAG